MRAKNLAPRPGVLHKLFNSHYPGNSVAFSTASKWLRGTALPEQDKLQVLASVLGIEPHVLRFGTRTSQVREPAPPWPHPIDTRDQAAIHALLTLPEAQRALMRELILTLAKTR